MLVSELVGNAVLHARTDVEVESVGTSVWAVLCPEVQDPREGADAALATWLDTVDGS